MSDERNTQNNTPDFPYEFHKETSDKVRASIINFWKDWYKPTKSGFLKNNKKHCYTLERIVKSADVIEQFNKLAKGQEEIALSLIEELLCCAVNVPFYIGNQNILTKKQKSKEINKVIAKLKAAADIIHKDSSFREPLEAIIKGKVIEISHIPIDEGSSSNLSLKPSLNTTAYNTKIKETYNHDVFNSVYTKPKKVPFRIHTNINGIKKSNRAGKLYQLMQNILLI